MSDISKVKLPDNSEYDIKDTVARAKGSIYYGTCTTAAGTKDKVATVSSDQNFVLQVGTMVAIKFTYTNSYSATSSNKITLNVNSTGALNIWYAASDANTGTNTTAYGLANYVNYYMYDGTYWVFAGRSVDANDGNYNLRYNAAIKAGTSDLVAGNIICASGGLYSHLKTGNAFDIKWPILYANGATTASSTSTNNYILINFNVNTTQSMTLTAYDPVYIKGTLSGTTFTPISTAPLTQTKPSSVDNYHYILLGIATSTTHLYLLEHHPIYKYDNDSFRIYEQTFAVNNNLVNTDLNTVKQVGFYYAGSNNGCSNMPSDYTGANNFGLEVIKMAIGDYYAQIYYPHSSTTTWIRICQSGTWGDWTDYTRRVKQTATSTNANYEVLFSNSANNTTETAETRKDSGLTFNPSTDTLTTKYVNPKVTKAMTGTGTAGSDAGSGTSPRYTPSKWTFNSGVTVANGEIYFIQIPVAGGTYGVWLSLNNGTNYYPVAVSAGKSRFTTHYGKNTVIAVTYESAGVCTCYALAGADTTADVTGCFRVLNDYDSGNTNTNVTQTATTTNANYEVLFSVTADNTTRTEGARKNSNLKFNPSTGNLQTTQINGVTVGSDPKFTDENTTYTFAEGSVNGKFTVTPSGGSAQSVPIHGLSNLAYKNKVDTSYMEPLYTNTYTGLIGSANDAAGASFYCGTIMPTSYTGIWKIHYRIYAEAAGRTDSKSWHDCWAEGNRSSLRTYANYNTIVDTSYNPLRFTLVYRATEAGITNNYGHLLGVGLRDSWARTTAANSRTVKVEIIETIDCTYTPWDTAVKYANVPGTGSTNYSGLSEIDAYNNGLRETGDDNTVVHNRINYFSGKTGTTGVYAYTLFMEDGTGTYQSIVTSSTTGTKTVNSHGFRVGSPLWYSTTTYAANTNISGQNVIYSAISTIDSRYSFNVGLTAGALTTYQPIYLVGTINGSDGLFYLDSTWWTQTPNNSSKIYILVGGVYASSTSSQQYALYEQNPWYRYEGGQLKQLCYGYLKDTGGTMWGSINMNNRSITNVGIMTTSHNISIITPVSSSSDSNMDWILHDYNGWSIVYNQDPLLTPFTGNPIAILSSQTKGSPIVATGSRGIIKAVTSKSQSIAINHNNIYRGDELLSNSHFGTGSTGLTALHNAVSSGDFSDIYIGDTITVTMAAVSGYEADAQTVEWVVMGIDLHLGQPIRWYAYNYEPQHHLILVPKDCFKTPQKWHTSDDITSVGYDGSAIQQTILNAYGTSVRNSLNDYVLQALSETSSGVDTTSFSYYNGTNNGRVTNGSPNVRNGRCVLLDEMEVVGTRYVCSLPVAEWGIDNIQLPGFRLNPDLIWKKVNGTVSDWWLKDIACKDKVGVVYTHYGYLWGPWAFAPTLEKGVCPKIYFG